jgi:hypothetical protein
MKSFREFINLLESNAEQLEENLYDTIKHPKYGKIKWSNMGGAHVISTRNKEGALKIYAMGTHKEIADKWGRLKSKLNSDRFGVKESFEAELANL